MATKQFRKTLLHWLFRIGIVFKGLDGLTELVGGFLFVFFSSDAMSDFVDRNTRGVLQWDPDNLLGHGAIKVLMVAGLWRDKRWVFPVALVVLLRFIGFQIYHLCGHYSIGLVVFTLLDAVIAALVWIDYRSLGKNTSRG